MIYTNGQVESTIRTTITDIPQNYSKYAVKAPNIFLKKAAVSGNFRYDSEANCSAP